MKFRSILQRQTSLLIPDQTSKMTWMISCRHSCADTFFLSLNSLNCTLDGWKCLTVPESRVKYLRFNVERRSVQLNKEGKNISIVYKTNITYENTFLPRSFLMEGFAPYSNNNSTISRSPRHTAYCNGVDPDSDATCANRLDLTSSLQKSSCETVDEFPLCCSSSCVCD